MNRILEDKFIKLIESQTDRTGIFISKALNSEDAMLRVSDRLSKVVIVRENLKMRVESKMIDKDEKAETLIRNLENTTCNYLRLIEVYGDSHHIIVHSDPELCTIFGAYEIFGNSKEDLQAFDPTWKSVRA